MDLHAIREAAIEATSRALYDKLGIVPSEDSDEWEAEYRRQFAALKLRLGAEGAVAPPSATPASLPPPPPHRSANGGGSPSPARQRQWPELTGTPEQKRWAAAIRDDRMREIATEPFRAFLTHAWTRAKVWVDTRDVPIATLMQRLKPQFDEYRRKAAEAAQARAAAARQQAAEAAEHRRKLKEAGITPEGLVELIDASERFADPVTIAGKIADLTAEMRHLRIFETNDPNLLLVKEKKGPVQLPDYVIERDDGLVADLRLFAQMP